MKADLQGAGGQPKLFELNPALEKDKEKNWAIWALGRSLAFMIVVPSCSHMIAICDLPIQLPTSKEN